jgi:hypothetical protein
MRASKGAHAWVTDASKARTATIKKVADSCAFLGPDGVYSHSGVESALRPFRDHAPGGAVVHLETPRGVKYRINWDGGLEAVLRPVGSGPRARGSVWDSYYPKAELTECSMLEGDVEREVHDDLLEKTCVTVYMLYVRTVDELLDFRAALAAYLVVLAAVGMKVTDVLPVGLGGVYGTTDTSWATSRKRCAMDVATFMKSLFPKDMSRDVAVSFLERCWAAPELFDGADARRVLQHVFVGDKAKSAVLRVRDQTARQVYAFLFSFQDPQRLKAAALVERLLTAGPGHDPDQRLREALSDAKAVHRNEGRANPVSSSRHASGQHAWGQHARASGAAVTLRALSR